MVVTEDELAALAERSPGLHRAITSGMLVQKRSGQETGAPFPERDREIQTAS